VTGDGQSPKNAMTTAAVDRVFRVREGKGVNRFVTNIGNTTHFRIINKLPARSARRRSDCCLKADKPFLPRPPVVVVAGCDSFPNKYIHSSPLPEAPVSSVGVYLVCVCVCVSLCVGQGLSHRSRVQKGIRKVPSLSLTGKCARTPPRAASRQVSGGTCVCGCVCLVCARRPGTQAI
jgi:hypothetical protein